MPTPYTPAGTTFPAFPWNLVKNGEVYNFDSIQQSVDPAKGLIGKCMDGIAYLFARSNASLGVLGVSRTRVIGTTWVSTSGGAWTIDVVGIHTTASAFSSQLLIPIPEGIVPAAAAAWRRGIARASSV